MEIKSERVTRHFNLAISEIKKLPYKKYLLIDIGAYNHFLKKQLPKNITYKSLDVVGKQDYLFDLDKGKFPIKSNLFDIVVCLEVLEHTMEPHKVMKEILRISKKDAIFFLSMPNDYNFLGRLYFLFAKKTDMQKPFKVVTEHLHIHMPRVKDITSFFSEFVNIRKVEYIWQSRASMTSDIAYSVDKVINILAKLFPTLFARIVTIKGTNK